MSDKTKSLFDHINQIKSKKDSDYYNSLNDSEKKSFNQYMILQGLSMSRNSLDEISYLGKYLNLIPNRLFYKVCCDLIQHSDKFTKWIKNENCKINKTLLSVISMYYEIGITESKQYCEYLIKLEKTDEFENILKKYGYTDKEIKEILK